MIESLLSLAALIVAILAYVEAKRQSSASLRLSEQEIELVRQQLAENRNVFAERMQANVSVRMYKEGKSNWKLRIYNSGPAEAKNVRILLHEGSHFVTEGAIKGKFPMARMEKGQSVDCWAHVDLSSPSKETVVIQWDDPSGLNREKQTEVTL